MLHRYVAINDCIRKIDDDDVQELLLNTDDDQDVDRLLRLLADINSVTKSLQESNVSLADARVILNGVIEEHPTPQARLRARSNIVENSAFESAICKLQNSEDLFLTTSELYAVRQFAS